MSLSSPLKSLSSTSITGLKRVYKWLSEADHVYLLYCSPKGFGEYEVND